MVRRTKGLGEAISSGEAPVEGGSPFSFAGCFTGLNAVVIRPHEHARRASIVAFGKGPAS